MTDTDTAANSIRSWLGIPYATAERFRRPVLLPFNPDRPYDQNGPAPLQAGDNRTKRSSSRVDYQFDPATGQSFKLKRCCRNS